MIPRGGKTTVRSQVLREVAANHADLFVDQRQCSPHADSHRNPTLRERYINGEVHIITGFLCPDGKQYIALFQNWISAVRPETKDAALPSRIGVASGIVHPSYGQESPFHLGQDCVSCSSNPDSQNQPMLVDIVQCMESPEVLISALVWVQSADSINRRLRHALYLSRNAPFGVCIFGGGFAMGNA